jgi:hypothetical protein
MPGFAENVDDDPMLFAELNGVDPEGEKFSAPQTTTNQKTKDGMVPLAPQSIALGL